MLVSAALNLEASLILSEMSGASAAPQMLPGPPVAPVSRGEAAAKTPREGAAAEAKQPQPAAVEMFV